MKKPAAAGFITGGCQGFAMQLVLIEWIDSSSGKGWQPLDEINEDRKPVHCRSVGWLLCRTKDVTTLVAHISGEKNGNVRLCGAGDITIPNRSIVKRRVLSKS